MRGGASRRGAAPVASAPEFNPLTAFAWAANYWASDPGWTNPGDGLGVSSWRDSVAAVNALQAVGANQPLYRASYAGLNGKPAIEFDGTNDYLLSTATLTLAQPFSVVVIGKTDSTVAQSAATAKTGGTLATLFRHSTAATFAANAGTRLDGAATVTTATFAVTTGVMFTSVLNNLSSKVIVGAATATGAAGTGAYTANPVLLGASGTTPTAPLDGAMAFVGFIAGDITAHGEWANLKAWATSFYGVPN